MAKHANIIKHSLLALFLVFAFSCRKVFQPAEWEPEAVFPMAHTDLTINNLVTDTTHLKSDSTGLSTLVFEQKLDSLSLSVLDTFSAPPFYSNFKLDSLKLDVPPFTRTITFGELARTLEASNDPSTALVGQLILGLQGKSLSSDPLLAALVPPTLNIPVGKIPIDLNQFFESAVLKSGTVDLKIENHFPMKVEKLDFDIENHSDSSILIQETGIQIDINSTFEKTYDLAGKMVEGKLDANVTTLQLLTDKYAIIDTNQSITISMTFSSLQVESATAIFPDQDVVSDYQVVSLDGMGNRQLKEAIIEKGSVVMEVISTIQDSIFMTYSMPKTTLNGVPLVFKGVIPPATATSNTSIRLEVPVDNYNLNLSSPPDYYNRYVYAFNAHVKYTGKKVYLSLKDSIVVNVYMNGIQPSYVRGYLGSLDTIFSSSIATDIFSKVQATSFSPENVNVTLKVDNGLGVAGEIKIDQLTAINANGSSLQAQDVNLINNWLKIDPAKDHPFRASLSAFHSSPSSNFPDLVSLFPTHFNYSIQAFVGLTLDTNSFVYNYSKLKPTLEIQMPLNVSVQGLVLRDTIAMQATPLGFETAGGALAILAYNGFPFSGTVRAIFQNPNGTQMVLNGTSVMLAADVDPVTGRVVAKKYSKVTLPFTNDELYTITMANSVIIEALFDTPPGKKVKIYSDESAQLTLTGKVVPKISK